MLVKWTDLTDDAKRQVRSRYVNWKADPTATSFEDWAQSKAFHVKGNGHLDDRYHYCSPAFMADWD